MLKYRRVLLKLSGEAFGSEASSIDLSRLSSIASDLKKLQRLGVQVAVVVGGGNILRGKGFSSSLFSQTSADHMAMLATVMNGLALEEVLVSTGLSVLHRSAFPIARMVGEYHHREAVFALDAGKIVIFSGGTGNPFVTTDTTASLRALEIKADVIFKATKVNGVYSTDPIKTPTATFYSRVSFDEAIKQSLGVMDLSAISMCRDHNMPIRVFNMNEPDILVDLVQGSEKGTLVNSDSDKE